MEQITLDWGGQNCHIELIKRNDGSKYVRFCSLPGYGYPSLEKCELEKVLEKLKKL